VTAILLGLRFILELCLFAAMFVIGWGAVGNHLIGAVAGVVLAVAVATIWGVLLSPKRKVDLSLTVRVIVEIALFGTAALGLSAFGLPMWGAALFVAEVVVLVALANRGLPPGADVADRFVG